ncbi:rRNA-processing protein efg1 isoform X2 [Ipomoea triloba]|uniref:rRNA-processing protein efg1 isoform X2 n=1 Tax=Ipomoea triloba TaxID=35885 RepID=UPI00125D3634|nr:rRNA-processing protein efg1 isoform X2 [Ipomoea triloba]
MVHGGYGKRRVSERSSRRPKSLGPEKKSKPKSKAVSLKNQIRSVERMLRKDLPLEVREAQEKKLEDFKKQQEIHNRLAVERKIFLRNRKIKFFDRRKIERRIRRLEKQQRTSSGQAQETQIAEQLAKLKEDLEYVRFFPKTEKYVSLFTGGDDEGIIEKRTELRKQIKANLVAAAASGKDLEETGSEDDGILDLSDDDFFVSGSSSDEADADDEWTDKSTREQASSASGKAASGMSSDERNQISARALMPPPRPSSKSFSSSLHNKSRFGGSSSKKSSYRGREVSSSSNTSDSINRSSFRKGHSLDSLAGNSGNQSSNSDAHKPRRKRRPKKKKQQT